MVRRLALLLPDLELASGSDFIDLLHRPLPALSQVFIFRPSFPGWPTVRHDTRAALTNDPPALGTGYPKRFPFPLPTALQTAVSQPY